MLWHGTHGISGTQMHCEWFEHVSSLVNSCQIDEIECSWLISNGKWQGHRRDSANMVWITVTESGRMPQMLDSSSKPQLNTRPLVLTTASVTSSTTTSSPLTPTASTTDPIQACLGPRSRPWTWATRWRQTDFTLDIWNQHVDPKGIQLVIVPGVFLYGFYYNEK